MYSAGIKPRNISIGHRLHEPLHHMDTQTHTDTHTHTHIHTHTHTHTHTNKHTHVHKQKVWCVTGLYGILVRSKAVHGLRTFLLEPCGQFLRCLRKELGSVYAFLQPSFGQQYGFCRYPRSYKVIAC